jgi:hypothetical protein
MQPFTREDVLLLHCSEIGGQISAHVLLVEMSAQGHFKDASKSVMQTNEGYGAASHLLSDIMEAAS